MTDTPRPAGLRDGTPPPPAGTGVRLTAIPATDTTQPDPSSSQLADFWRGLNGTEGTAAMTETTQPQPDEDPRRDALRCAQCPEFRADDSPGGWHDAREHADAAGHRVDRITPLDREPLTGTEPQVAIHLMTGSQTLSAAVTLRPEEMTCPACQARWDRIHSLPARKPLTESDIPAGQGPSSLFLTPDGDDFDLRFKHADGRVVVIGVTLDQLSGATTAALRDHLAATLPTVTDGEA